MRGSTFTLPRGQGRQDFALDAIDSSLGSVAGTEHSMSYSVSTGVVTAEELDAKLDAMTTDYPGEMGDAMREHIAAAREAIKRIVASGVMGKGRKFSVGVTGHANPGHEPLAGWSNDFMQITITHDPYEPPAPKVVVEELPHE